jgi:hypothetical protein
LANRAAGTEQLEARTLLSASGLQAAHRSGQTFLTWQEDNSVTGEEYHVYRHNAPITVGNLHLASKLTSKWGPLDDATSVHQLAGEGVPTHFVIEDLGTALADDQGLFVHTVQTGQGGNWYYAVTQVTNGTEDTSNIAATSSPVAESVDTPAPILAASQNGGSGRVYTQFMDYSAWNPTFNGYAYNYSVALPVNYNPAQSYPLKLVFHAYTESYRYIPEAEFDWPAIQVFVDDPGEDRGSIHSWWYGYSADHNYRTNGTTPTSGTIENFTEQRVLKAIDEVIANGDFNVDETRIHAQGHSMGGSGALTYGIRYGNVFAGIYSSEGMTDYASSPTFQSEFEQLWGSQAANLAVVNRGEHAVPLQPYNGTGVWNWMNHRQQIADRRGDDMAFLMFGHGKDDDIIDWATQGQPFIAAVNQAGVGFTAEQRGDWGHNWMSFGFANHDMFTQGYGDLGDWIFRSDFSFPGISNATASGDLVPQPTGDDFYNLDIDWATPWNPFHDSIVDSADHYEISLRSRDGNQTADITLRNLQSFVTPAGSQVSWSNIDTDTGLAVQSGTVVADQFGLVTIPAFQISAGGINRLILNVESVPAADPPTITAPGTSTSNVRPTIEWSAVSGAVSYTVFVSNRSTGQHPYLRQDVAGTQFIPATDLPLGRYQVWVRAELASGQLTDWSDSQLFKVQPAAELVDVPDTQDTEAATITWTALPGADQYDVWVTNLTTGQNPVFREQQATGTSLELPVLTAGAYRAWIRGVTADGVTGAWSGFENFFVTARPELISPEGAALDTTPTFQWAAAAAAETYQVFVRDLGNGQTVANRTGISSTNWTIDTTLANGDYEWWVRAWYPGQVLSSWSVSSRFSVGGRPTLIGPTGTVSDTTPTITWQAVDGAAEYILHVSRVDGSGVAIRDDHVTGTSFTPTVPLAAAQYRVWIRAVSAGGQMTQWSYSMDFTVA